MGSCIGGLGLISCWSFTLNPELQTLNLKSGPRSLVSSFSVGSAEDGTSSAHIPGPQCSRQLLVSILLYAGARSLANDFGGLAEYQKVI